MPLITLDNISLRFSEKVILDEINATIHKGDKIGLIGRNGEGKSTFSKLIAKKMVYSLGAFTISLAPKKAIAKDAIPIKLSAGNTKFGKA